MVLPWAVLMELDSMLPIRSSSSGVWPDCALCTRRLELDSMEPADGRAASNASVDDETAFDGSPVSSMDSLLELEDETEEADDFVESDGFQIALDGTPSEGMSMPVISLMISPFSTMPMDVLFYNPATDSNCKLI